MFKIKLIFLNYFKKKKYEKKVNPVIETSNDLEMNSKITLDEDEDQGEMDIVFCVFLFSYTIYLASIDLLYSDGKDKSDVGKFNLIMSNLWAFFPVMQAQGLWLKLLLIITCYYSISWHWFDIGFSLPGDKDMYRILDGVFSILTIISYSLSWIPKCKKNKDNENKTKNNFWNKHFLGPPRETSEWRCRLTLHLFINIFTCILIGSILYVSNGKEGSEIQIICCWCFITIAILSALYQLFKGDMSIGNKYRKNFACWVLVGVIFGAVSFIYKTKSDNSDENSFFNHSVWHTYVFSCAYSFSRASEYLEIYRN
jgi:hypothetical protein